VDAGGLGKYHPPSMAQSAVLERIEKLVQGEPVVLFMKGTRNAPQCGFSATVVSILDQYLPHYETVNVLADPEVREGVKEYASWPTIPQLYEIGRAHV
jgi:monothiol glutaredoxin